MRAVTVIPGVPGSARLDDLPEPPPSDGDVLVRGLAWGICGTDREIARGEYGWAPPGAERLVLGHESLGEVIEAPGGSGLVAGDLVAGIVRHADPVPCPACAVGEWDMCRNGQYTEHGIKEIHGFARERYRLGVDGLVKVDPALRELGVLIEPASVVAKAWDHTERIGRRTTWAPGKVLVTGAGPIGLLAALLGVQRGLEVHVLDIVTEGVKPRLVEALGATYHTGAVADACPDADIVIECTGVGHLVFDVMSNTAHNGIVCLTGVSPGGRELGVDLGDLNRTMVLQNDVVFGSVNANRLHYELAAMALAAADRDWLAGLLTRRVPLDRWDEVMEGHPDDVKVVVDLSGE